MATEIIIGNGSPEGVTSANLGTFYVDTHSYSVFFKVKNGDGTNTGWRAINIAGYYMESTAPDETKTYSPDSIYYDSVNNDIYFYLENTQTGTCKWVLLNKGELKSGTGNPNFVNKIEGTDGDLYIEEEYHTLYVYSDGKWESILLLAITSTDVITKLSELMTNTTSINRHFFNIFFNPEPMDIRINQYDENGMLRTYTIPNRAKDSIALSGINSPEGVVYANIGQLYIDVLNSNTFIKSTGNDKNTGWLVINTSKFTEPVYFNHNNNSLSLRFDNEPTELSNNLLSSDTIFGELNKIRNGNSNELFSVAEPIEQEHATTKNYVDNICSTFFGYDEKTKTLHINAPILRDRTENIILMEQSENPISGYLFTPMFGRGLATKFVFDETLKEPENSEVFIQSNTPCTIRFTSVDNKIFDVYLYDVLTYAKCFDIDGLMQQGIKEMQITSLEYHDSVLIENIQDLYKGLSITIKAKETEEV